MKIIPVKGDLFSNEFNLEGIAIFVPCGMTGFRVDAEIFVEKYKDSEKVLIYDKNEEHRIYQPSDVREMIYRTMDMFYEHNARIVGMNAIRTTWGAGESEMLVQRAVQSWLTENDREDSFTVYLIDKRGGFGHKRV